MTKLYQVYQCHAPSGGISPVDDTTYETIEEARGAAEAMASEVSEFRVYQVGNQECKFPAFWAQAVRRVGGITILEVE